MRSLKFRAYNARSKLMLPVLRLFMNEECVEVQLNPDDFDNVFWYFDHIEVMQFTGITDDNGVEVYEGDIVEFYYQDLSEEHRLTREIFYDETIMAFNLTGIAGYTMQDVLSMKVIGNVHENSDLIEMIK